MTSVMTRADPTMMGVSAFSSFSLLLLDASKLSVQNPCSLD